MFDQEVKSLLEKIQLTIQSSKLKPDEIQQEKDFFDKIKSVDFTNYEEQLQADLKDANFKLNRKDLYDENTLIVFSLYECIFSFT
jgi:hypothetical protein